MKQLSATVFRPSKYGASSDKVQKLTLELSNRIRERLGQLAKRDGVEENHAGAAVEEALRIRKPGP